MHAEPATAQPRPGTRSLGGDFRKVLGASGASNLADGVFQIALPLIAARLSDSPLVVAGVAIVGRLPWLVFSLPAGVNVANGVQVIPESVEVAYSNGPEVKSRRQIASWFVPEVLV